MMKSAAALAFMLSVSLAPAQAPRVAVVRVADIHRQLEATTRANQVIKAKREEIRRDPRLARWNELYADLELRRKQLQSTTAKIDPEARLKLEREFAIKAREATALREDFESFSTAKDREIDAEMVAGMKQRLRLILETAEKTARDSGYDWVFDSSAISNTGVPLLLYAKGADDLTDRVAAALAEPPPAAPPSSQTQNNPAANPR